MKQLHTWLVTLLFTFAYVSGGQVTKTGILIDVMCGEVAALNLEKAASHKVFCSLSLNCRESGFGIITDGKFYSFDQIGNQEALKLLKGTRKKSHVKVEITGDLDGDTVRVSKIQEAE